MSVTAEPLVARNVKTVRTENQVYHFDSSRAAILATSPLASQLLDEIRSQPGVSLETLQGRFGDEVPEAVDELLEAGLLGPELPPAPRRAPKVHPQPRTLALNVSQGCNLACKYCYADVAGAASRKMAPETARQAVDYLMEQPGPKAHLTFFGGEPLLNFPLIRSTVEYAEGLSRQRKKPISFSTTTNGTLITEEIADFMNEHRVGVTVSMDGPPEVQDRNRPFHSGRGSSSVVTARLKILLERMKTRPVGARVTLSHGAGRVRDIFDYLMGLGFYEAGFSPASDSSPEIHLSEEEMENLLEDFQMLSRRYVAEAREGRYVGFANLSNMLVELDGGEVRPYPCGAGVGLFGVDYRGELYLCHRFAGQEEFRLGDVTTGLDLTRVEAVTKELHRDYKEECSTCWIRPVCAGGCYHEASVRQGDYRKANLHACNFLRRWTAIGLQAYVEILEVAPQVLQRLAGSRRKAQSFTDKGGWQ